MKVVFRADASVAIGTGHVMRCLTLADALRQRGHLVEFACVPLAGNVIDLIQKKGYLCHRLAQMQAAIPSDGDWLVVDHYQLAVEWEASMRAKFRHIMVIDDLANRQHDCECLLDQNDYFQNAARYEALTPLGCRLFLGPQYVLLRQEFFSAKQTVRERSLETAKKILASFGGTDPAGLAWDFLQWWEHTAWIKERHLELQLVIGANSMNRKKIEAYCRNFPEISLQIQTTQIARLLVESDIAVGAGGVSLWERCYLGIPSVTVIVAENQKAITEQAARDGLTLLAGMVRKDIMKLVATCLLQLLDNNALRRDMREKMLSLYPTHNESGMQILTEYMEGKSYGE